jgi:hypothetical protein
MNVNANNRKRYNPQQLRHPTDLTDGQWAKTLQAHPDVSG